jgi:hypothetical protein
MRRHVYALAAIAVSVLGCGGSQRQAEDMNWSSDEPEKSRPLRETEELQELQGPSAAPDQAGGSTLVGVRHDLMIAPSAPHKERCSCLAVEMGSPQEPKFQWRDKVPAIGPDATAIAISAKGVPCPGGDADESKRRASISAVHREGNDVVVEVEEVPEGRPLASGAVIARPGPGGSVYVKGRSPKLPYARATGSRCKVN